MRRPSFGRAEGRRAPNNSCFQSRTRRRDAHSGESLACRGPRTWGGRAGQRHPTAAREVRVGAGPGRSSAAANGSRRALVAHRRGRSCHRSGGRRGRGARARFGAPSKPRGSSSSNPRAAGANRCACAFSTRTSSKPRRRLHRPRPSRRPKLHHLLPPRRSPPRRRYPRRCPPTSSSSSRRRQPSKRRRAR